MMAYRPTSWVQDFVNLGGFGMRFGTHLVKEGVKNLVGTIWDQIKDYGMTFLIGVGFAIYVFFKFFWSLLFIWINNYCCRRGNGGLEEALLTQDDELSQLSSEASARSNKDYCCYVGGTKRLLKKKLFYDERTTTGFVSQ